MTEMGPEAFTASRWRRFDLFAVLGIPCRTPSLLAMRDTLRRFAVGYCPAERLSVRPRADHAAVMFFRGEHQWCHLTNAEFNAIFGGNHA